MAAGQLLRSLMAHPLTRGLDIDDPATTALRRTIIRGKPALRAIYDEWYHAIAAAIPSGDAPVLELGAGAGYLAERVPGLITSDIFLCPEIALVADGHRLPFVDGGLRGIAMTNVLHHLADVERFLGEAARCVQSGGVLVMVEPWVSAWSRLVYTHLHHEPFAPETVEWQFPPSGPLSGANGALPWIVFARDRARFDTTVTGWEIQRIAPLMPFRYLLSGGVSLRSLIVPGTAPMWRAVERTLEPWGNTWAMFALIVLRRSSASARNGSSSR